MSFETCAVKVKKWYEENSPDLKMPSSEIENMARLLNAEGEGAMNTAQFQAKMEESVDEYATRMGAKLKATRAMDLAIRAKGVTNTLENAKLWISKGMDELQAPVAAFYARILGGSDRPGVASNVTIKNMRQNLQTDFTRIFRNALGENEDAIMMAARDSKLVQDFYQEKWAIENKTQVGLSGNDQAIEIAKAFKATQNRVLTEGQTVSPFLQPAKSFIVSRNWNPELVVGDGSAEARGAFVDHMMKNFGEKSYVGNTPEEKRAIFDDMFSAIKAGTWNTPGSEASFWGVPGTGGDLARKMAPARSLVASDWKAEFESAAKYGDDPYTAMGKQIYGAADDIAKVTKWGSRMADNFQMELQKTAASLTPDQREFFLQHQKNFQDAFRVSMGADYSPANNIWAKAVQNLMNLKTAAGVGMHVPRSLGDFQNAVTLTRDMFGKNIVQNSAEMAAEMGKALLKYGDAKERMQDMGVFFQSTSREFTNAIYDPQAKPGATAQLAELIGKISGADRQQAWIKTGHATVMAKHFGEMSSQPFEALPAETQQGLARAGINKNAWNLVRGGQENLPWADGNTRQLITPEAIRTSTDNVAAELYLRQEGMWKGAGEPPPQLIQKARSQVALAYGGMLNEQVSMSAANLSDSSRYFMYRGLDPNSGLGLANKMMWQFKNAAISNAALVRRTYFNGTGSKSNIGALAQHLIMSGLYYTLGDCIVQAASGKNPQDPVSWEGAAKFAVGSGGGGIWADGIIHAMGQDSKPDMISSASESLLGPGISTIGESALAAAGTAKGIYEHLQGNDRASLQGKWWAKVLQGLTPGQNALPIKAGMDYFLMNELHTVMGSDGYLDQVRRQTEKRGQGFTFGNQNFWGN